jgi:hypothetical protein
LANPQEASAYLDTASVSWVDMLGLGNKETWRHLGKVFNLHLMAQEDVVNVPQRPKVVDYEDQKKNLSRIQIIFIKNKLV